MFLVAIWSTLIVDFHKYRFTSLLAFETIMETPPKDWLMTQYDVLKVNAFGEEITLNCSKYVRVCTIKN